MAPNEEHHELAWKLLPWFVNGSLNADEAVSVERHLASCPACRQEVERCRTLSAIAKSSGPRKPPAWAPSSRQFAQILGQVDAPHAASSAHRPSLARKLRSWLVETPPPMRWALALQAALIVALTGVLLAPAPPDAPYETLSRGADPAAGERARLRVVFAADTTEKELRDLLNSIDGRIVDGPTPQGVYTLQLSVAGPERARHISAVLARHSKVHFAAVEGSGAAR